MNVLADFHLEGLLMLSAEQVRRFCERWRITELAEFGSVLREDFRPDSDVDIMVTFASDVNWSLFDQAQMQGELSELLGRDVDLITRRAVEQSPNWIRRKSILDSAQTVYSTTL